MHVQNIFDSLFVRDNQGASLNIYSVYNNLLINWIFWNCFFFFIQKYELKINNVIYCQYLYGVFWSFFVEWFPWNLLWKYYWHDKIPPLESDTRAEWRHMGGYCTVWRGSERKKSFGQSLKRIQENSWFHWWCWRRSFQGYLPKLNCCRRGCDAVDTIVVIFWLKNSRKYSKWEWIPPRELNKMARRVGPVGCRQSSVGALSGLAQPLCYVWEEESNTALCGRNERRHHEDCCRPCLLGCECLCIRSL